MRPLEPGKYGWLFQLPKEERYQAVRAIRKSFGYANREIVRNQMALIGQISGAFRRTRIFIAVVKLAAILEYRVNRKNRD